MRSSQAPTLQLIDSCPNPLDDSTPDGKTRHHGLNSAQDLPSAVCIFQITSLDPSLGNHNSAVHGVCPDL